MVTVLALLARAGHGKTTCAKHLEKEYGARIVSLASPLKKVAQSVMGFSDSQLYGTQEEKEAIDPRFGMSARIFLQKLGTEGLRTHMGNDIFCHALRGHIIKLYNESGQRQTVYVIDDARFINEIQFTRALHKTTESGGGPKMFGHTIKIVCTDAPPSGNDNHPSEREIDLVQDYLIDATITSSRAAGMDHLTGELENALKTTPMSGVREALRAQREALKPYQNVKVA